MLCNTQCVSVFGDILVDFVLHYKEKLNKWISLTFIITFMLNYAEN